MIRIRTVGDWGSGQSSNLGKLTSLSSPPVAADASKLPSIAASIKNQSERRASQPAEPIAKKKELLFSDDFEWAELGKAWAIVVPTFSLENGTLKGTQMRFDAPAVGN